MNLNYIFLFFILLVVVTEAGPIAYATCQTACAGGCALTGPAFAACYAACQTGCTAALLAPTP